VKKAQVNVFSSAYISDPVIMKGGALIFITRQQPHNFTLNFFLKTFQSKTMPFEQKLGTPPTPSPATYSPSKKVFGGRPIESDCPLFLN